MYVNEEDVRVLLTWLTESAQVAFLHPDGIGRWKAVHELNELPNAPVEMWHIPSGPLPLLGKERHDPVQETAAPWNGWTEQRPGADKPALFWTGMAGRYDVESATGEQTPPK
jgi:hypothetical protein